MKTLGVGIGAVGWREIEVVRADERRARPGRSSGRAAELAERPGRRAAGTCRCRTPTRWPSPASMAEGGGPAAEAGRAGGGP